MAAGRRPQGRGTCRRSRRSECAPAAVDDGVAQLGRLDIVLANAGISTPHSTLDIPDDVWDTMIAVNLSGQFKTIRASVPHIIEGGRGGAVVITSSLAAMKANVNTAHYTAAKTGLIGLMKVLAVELAPYRIRVNTVHPTTVNTAMVLNEPTYRLFRPDLPNPTAWTTRWRHARSTSCPRRGSIPSTSPTRSCTWSVTRGVMSRA